MMIPHWPIYTGPNKDFENSVLRTKLILSRLGNPHLKMKNIIHITGTKGKGSTALYISNILKSCGYCVNTYISPHIYECNERILLNGDKVSDEDLHFATEAVRIVCEENCGDDGRIEPSLFEAMTCSAFLLMSKNNADFNVIEVGMGGKNDATNVFDDNPPIVCLFVPIHLDHTKFLGDKVEQVALNKSFLIKNGTKYVIMSSQSKEAKSVISNVAKQSGIHNCDIISYGDDYDVFKNEEDGRPVYESSRFDTCFPFIQPNMQGDYQLINAGCAISTCLALVEGGFANKLSVDYVNEGIKNTINIVRMQKITSGKLFNLLPSGSIFYVDGAHNQLASHALSAYIQEFIQEMKKNNQKYKICVAIARTKNANNKAFLQEFYDNNGKFVVDLIICTRANLESIPEPPERIADACKSMNINHKTAYTIDEVLQQVVDFAKGEKVLLICTGSLYLARDVDISNKED